MLVEFTSVNPLGEDQTWVVPHTVIKGMATTSGKYHRLYLDLPNHAGSVYVTKDQAGKIAYALEAVRREDNLIAVN